jgi:hypothetical protein
MEADWEVEIGGDAPVIDGSWDGLVDLRRTPERVTELPESQELSVLAEALVQLNSPVSPVWTSKCDIWRPEEVVPDEMDADSEEAKCAIACYIDLLPRTNQQWPSPDQAVAACRSVCLRLHQVSLRCCRADLIVRGAWIAPQPQNAGVTAYLTACGSSLIQANRVLASALRVFVEAVMRDEHSQSGASKLQ